MRGAAGLAGDQIVLLSVGRLERNKGFIIWRVHWAACGNGRDWHWVIAGTGPYRRTIEEAIQHAGIERRVQWLGRIEDRELHAWYEAADLFVHPTVYQGSSLVTLEAMTHRRPVVASRAGGLPDESAARDYGMARGARRSRRACRRSERRTAAARELARDGRRRPASG